MQKKKKPLDWQMLYSAYVQGIFPMAEESEIYWYCPDPRAVLEFEQFHIPQTLKSVLKKDLFEIRINTAFRSVIEGCQNRKSTWISKELVQAYSNLHEKGFAHSVEAWQNDTLVGGLYGVSIGGAFMGESMFHTVPEASKVSLVYLVERLRERKFELLDIQFMTKNLKRFGATEIPREQYLKRLKKAIKKNIHFHLD